MPRWLCPLCIDNKQYVALGASWMLSIMRDRHLDREHIGWRLSDAQDLITEGAKELRNAKPDSRESTRDQAQPDSKFL